MPPKKDKTKEFAYALIWFISTRERYVLETSKLPKTRRKKDSVVKILWNDASTQISKQYKVKIIELSNDKNKLENIILDETGNVCDEHTKVLQSITTSASDQDFLKPGPSKARISDDHCIYFPKSTIAYIEKRTENAVNSNFSDWKNLVKEALIEVYGNNISRYCAKGTSTRTDRLPINSQLYDAIYAWANNRSEETIDSAEYIKHINKIASNKRKSKKNKSLSVTTVTSSQAQDSEQMIDLESNNSNIQLQDSNPNINSSPTESRPYISPKIDSEQSELGISQGQNLLSNVDMWSEHPTRSSINSLSHLSGPQHSNPSHTYQHSSDSSVTQYPGFYYPVQNMNYVKLHPSIAQNNNNFYTNEYPPDSTRTESPWSHFNKTVSTEMLTPSTNQDFDYQYHESSFTNL